MKLGVNTFIWAAEFGDAQLPLLPKLKASGFDGIEVSLFRPADFRARDIRRAAEANHLEVTICSVLVQGLSLISDDESVRRKTQAHLKEAIKSGAEAGAALIAGPLYSPVGYLPGRRRSDDEWKRAVEGYQMLGDTLSSHGVTLAVEPLNRFETYFLNTAADAAALAKAVGHPNVGILFDTFHANIEEKNIAAALDVCKEVLVHVHISENDRSTPGKGGVDWRETWAGLKKIRYGGMLVVEAFGQGLPGLAAATKIWRRMFESEEKLAQDAIAFMKRSWEEA